MLTFILFMQLLRPGNEEKVDKDLENRRDQM
jgi:hypothetical protein